MEIERKFIVNRIPCNIDEYPYDEIEQGYLFTYPLDIRIRKKSDKHYFTCKSKGDLIRQEIETEISEECYRDYANMVKHNTIAKRRYYIPLYEGLVAELDVFKKQLEGLVMVEVEFKDEDSADSFIAPDWFGQEVTKLNEYKNVSLAEAIDLTSLLYK